MDPRYFEANLSTYMSAAAEEKPTIKSTPGLLFNLDIANVDSADNYVWIFDNSAASGTALIPPFKIAAGELRHIDGPIKFTTGLTVAASSTHATYSATSASDLFVRALYK